MADRGKTLKVVGITCGVIVLDALVGGGICVACGASLFQQTVGPGIEVERFLQDVKARRDDAAYRRTSLTFRMVTPRERFSAFLDNHNGFRTHTASSSEYTRVDGARSAAIRVRLTAPSGDLVVAFQLVPFGGGWQINGIDIVR